MIGNDWRSPAAYERAQNFDTIGLAWECLRRNPDYHHDYAIAESGASVDTGVADAFPLKFGVCFPCRSGQGSG